MKTQVSVLPETFLPIFLFGIVAWLSACGADRANAPMLTATQLETNITAQVAQHNYQGALAVIDTLVKRYPGSAESENALAHIDDLKSKSEKQISERQVEIQKVEARKGSSIAQATGNRLEECRAKLKQSQKLEVLHDLDWQPPAEPKVVVGRIFYKIPIDAKQGFAATVNCFLLAGETDKLINFDVLDWQSGKAVGRFHNGRFVML